MDKYLDKDLNTNLDEKNTSPSYWPWLAAAFALAGIVLFIFATFGPPASSSGFVATLKGGIQTVAPDYVEEKAHYLAMPDTGSWLFAFVLGMAMGGFLAGRTSKIEVRDVPEIWEKKFGKSRIKRFGVTFLGGFIILFASRLAGGCTLGLFISGSTQLAISGLYFGAVIFAFAMVTSRLLYGGRIKKEE